jgi:glucokinase
MKTEKLALGVDIGGTQIKIGLVTSEGRILETKDIMHSVPSNPGIVVKNLARAIKSMAFWKNRQLMNRLCGIGIAVAGDTDHQRGRVRFAANFGWNNVPLREMLRKNIRMSVVVDNDANAACWGSYCIEFKRKVDNLMCLTLGTGIGGGIVINKRLYRGSTGTAGEIGHAALYPDGIKCSCGNTGCLERYVGVYDLVKNVRKRVIQGEETIIRELVKNNLDAVTPEVIFKAACKGDKFAKDIWEKTGEYLGTAIASAVNVLNPEIVVLCGGISSAGKFLLGPIKNTVKLRALDIPAGKVKIIVSKLGKRLGLIGAGCLVLYPDK